MARPGKDTCSSSPWVTAFYALNRHRPAKWSIYYGLLISGAGLGRYIVKNYVDIYDRHRPKGGSRLWKILSFTVAIPGVALCYINAQLKEAEHKEHFHQPEFVPYEHLRLRSKRFPWGDGNHSLFHDPKVNALPDGYEEGGESEEE